MISANVPPELAIREYQRIQDTAYRPTAEEREEFIAEWLEDAHNKLGTEYFGEAFAEASELQLLPLMAAWQQDDAIEIRAAMRDLLNAYWRPYAERAADDHDWSNE